MPRTTLVSLQKDRPAADQAERYSGTAPLINIGPALRDYDDLMAVVANLDLVVTVDTSVAHLAGAMGKPVWIMLAVFPDWRWLLNGDDTPWYPTARLFRQKGWSEVPWRVTEAPSWHDVRWSDVLWRVAEAPWREVLWRVAEALDGCDFTPPVSASTRSDDAGWAAWAEYYVSRVRLAEAELKIGTADWDAASVELWRASIAAGRLMADVWRAAAVDAAEAAAEAAAASWKTGMDHGWATVPAAQQAAEAWALAARKAEDAAAWTAVWRGQRR